MRGLDDERSASKDCAEPPLPSWNSFARDEHTEANNTYDETKNTCRHRSSDSPSTSTASPAPIGVSSKLNPSTPSITNASSHSLPCACACACAVVGGSNPVVVV